MSDRTDHVVIDCGKQVVRCNHCGETVPLPLGVVEWVVGVTRAFVESHRYCKPGAPVDRRCYFGEVKHD